MTARPVKAPRLLPGGRRRAVVSAQPGHARKEIPKIVLHEAQNLFETTDIPLAEIARRVGLHRSLLHRTVLRKGWSRPEPKARKARVAERLRARIEKELCSVEISLAHSRSKESREAARQSADTLASLMRTLPELRRHDLEEAQMREAEQVDYGEELETLRRTLAERLERLQAEHQG